ncbi:GPALPP motifs-containing protein 1-like [Carcharodon carcharias]|uniref:GPALPP motifs-containing protein 1-like n=1 Tax=Carcharodon carcharias TaxID=13397 RepID=UPI001B7DFCF9|nr:GPALPP motifs-containing protein 1-like [Carcharodon carcharias]
MAKGLVKKLSKSSTDVHKSFNHSIWIGSPVDKERKDQETLKAKESPAKEPEWPSLSERDKQIAKEAPSYSEFRRLESLLSMHNKKLTRKAEVEKYRPQGRWAFDCEQNLQFHQFHEAQVKALSKKPNKLNTRFSHGKAISFCKKRVTTPTGWMSSIVA